MCLFPGRRAQRTFHPDTRHQLSWPQLSVGEETQHPAGLCQFLMDISLFVLFSFLGLILSNFIFLRPQRAPLSNYFSLLAASKLNFNKNDCVVTPSLGLRYLAR